MKSKTETLSAALRMIANETIARVWQLPDNVPATCFREVADRLEELQKRVDDSHVLRVQMGIQLTSAKYEGELFKKRIEKLEKERDEAHALNNELKKEINHHSSKGDKMTDEQINAAIDRIMGCDLNDRRCDSCHPDWVNDLNAMHEAEGTLPLSDLWTMKYNLPLQSDLEFRSTARQRAEAFLRTLDKWKSEN
jgi:hypothetical protein